jgi:YVTN family beta-propeller protein
VGDGPCSLLIDNTGSKAYVFNHYSNTMSIIDIMRRVVTASVPLESSPVRGQFNRKGDRLYVIFSNSPYLSVFNVASLAVVRRQFVGMGAYSMKVDTKTDLLYIGKRGGEGVDVYNPFSLTPSYNIPTEGSVSYMTRDGEENNLYFLMPGKKIVSIVNPISRKVVGGIDVGEDPQWVTMMGER